MSVARTLAIALILGVAAGCGSRPSGTRSTPPTAAAVIESPEDVDPAAFLAATLAAEGEEVVGRLGSYTLDGTGSDTPWLPFDVLPMVTLKPDSRPEIRFDYIGPVTTWAASIAAEDDRLANQATQLADGHEAPGAASVTLPPIPPGRWVLAVSLERSDGRGGGMIYWAITVPE